MGNKSIMKDLSLLITVITLAATLTLVNCQEKKDENFTPFSSKHLCMRKREQGQQPLTQSADLFLIFGHRDWYCRTMQEMM